MKSLAKLRKEQIERDMRDTKAFNVILWFLLNTLHGAPWDWGKVRLQRVYDACLELIYSNKDDFTIGYSLEAWAERMGLTEEEFYKRKAERERDNGAV